MQLREMETSITPLGVRTLLWFFNKSFRIIVRGLFVESNSLVQNVKEPLQAGKTVILMPIYRSFADFFILTYVQILQGLEVPYTFGN
jgi:glycerol-3-phosphate O-acyltransferase